MSIRMGADKIPMPPAAAIARRLRNGATVADLAAEYGASVRTVQQRLNDAGWGQSGKPKQVQRHARRSDFSFNPQEWIADALCATTGNAEDFHPSEGDAQAAKRAKAVCADCPVRARCLDYILACEATAPGGRHGVWGGMSPTDRERLVKGGAA